MSAPHTPVMLNEVIEALAPQDGEHFIDGTFGAGGYSNAILNAAKCYVFAIDRDPSAIARGLELASSTGNRLTIALGRFSEMDQLAVTRLPVDGVALDLGVSSMQFDEAERGFSFQNDGPLDMRMGGDAQGGKTAAGLVNDSPNAELARIFKDYGEERRARHVANVICGLREETPITRTKQLAEIVSKALGGVRAGKIHPATRTFQALRIAVNDELSELYNGLRAAERSLSAGGRLAVVSFHSLEDRIVKQFLTARTGNAGRGSRHLPEQADGPAPSFEYVFRGSHGASDQEVAQNPRARSAKLRAARRTSAPAWDVAEDAA